MIKKLLLQINKHKFIIITIIVFILLIYSIILTIYSPIFNLDFNSQEFNNLATPIVSALGVIGLIYTIYLSVKQLVISRSEVYYKGLLERINKIRTQEYMNEGFSYKEYLDFYNFLSDKYELLISNPEYKRDLKNYNTGKKIPSKSASYHSILSEIRIFHVESLLIQTEIYTIINEVIKSNQLDISYKKLLFNHIHSTFLTYYMVNCYDFLTEKTKIVENLYLGFHKNPDHSKFFNSYFLNLYNFVLKNREELSKYMLLNNKLFGMIE